MNQKIRNNLLVVFVLLVAISIVVSCAKDPVIYPYKTRNLVLVLMDGPRFSETFGDANRTNIPYLNTMLPDGVLLNNFRNNGETQTTAGNTALVTGHYQVIANNGAELPLYPSFLQVWQEKYQENGKTWIVSSKDKIEVLSDCIHSDWNGKFRPQTNCGIAGWGTGYREDSTTYRLASNLFTTQHPRISYILFKQPDAAGHTGDSLAYIQGIVDADRYIGLLYNQVMNDPFYANNTTFIVTNDHGRHLDPPLGLGFTSHGDGCEGCRHIWLYAAGPDFKKNVVDSTAWDQVDLTATIAELFDLKMEFCDGEVITSLFRNLKK